MRIGSDNPFDQVDDSRPDMPNPLETGIIFLGGASDPINKSAWGSDASQATPYGGGFKYEHDSIPALTKNDRNAKKNR